MQPMLILMRNPIFTMSNVESVHNEVDVLAYSDVARMTAQTIWELPAGIFCIIQ